MIEPLRLPLGIQTFEEIRRGGYVYVDKTKYLADMYKEGARYFLSRPRGFGRSLTVSALGALFSGKRELFAGLAAEEIFDRPDYRPVPVVQLDMGKAQLAHGVDGMLSNITLMLRQNAETYGLTLTREHPGEAIRELLRKLHDGHGNVAVLVDNYDAPLLDALDKPDMAEQVKSVIHGFLLQIKAADEYLHFVFVTGVSKLFGINAFSATINLYDLSMDGDYAAMLGYTQEELEYYFAPHITAAASAMGISTPALLDGIREYYGGFSFDGKTMLYNPLSTVSFFSKRDFRNYWFDRDTMNFTAKYMKDRHLTAEQFRGVEVSRDFLAMSDAITDAPALSFLYQTGCLSLKLGSVCDFVLDYPNLEALQSMSKIMTMNILGDLDRADEAGVRLWQAMEDRDTHAVRVWFNQIMAHIPYNDYISANASSVENADRNYGEWLCRSMLLSYVRGAGIRAQAPGPRGIADMVARCGDWTWIIKLSIAYNLGYDEDEPEELGNDFRLKMEAIYHDLYKAPVFFSAVIDGDKNAIIGFSGASWRKV